MSQNYAGTPSSNGSISALVLESGSSLFDQFTGSHGVIPSGTIGSENLNFGFESGYISNYTLQGDVSSFPSDSVSFDVYGKVEQNNSVGEQDNIGIKGIKSKDVHLSGTGKLEVEHIQSFSYSISTNWKPNYIAGNHFPVEVSQVDGYSLVLDVNLIARETQIQAIYDNFNRATENGVDLSIVLGECLDSPLTYKVPKAQMDAENLSAGEGGFLNGTVRFITYFEDLEDLA